MELERIWAPIFGLPSMEQSNNQFEMLLRMRENVPESEAGAPVGELDSLIDKKVFFPDSLLFHTGFCLCSQLRWKSCGCKLQKDLHFGETFPCVKVRNWFGRPYRSQTERHVLLLLALYKRYYCFNPLSIV